MNMALSGAARLHQHAEHVNALNVFPVPDGDTGTNMNLTMSFGVQQLQAKPSAEIGKAAEVLSKGLLMGARGNSGVILSQLFRGMAKACAGRQELNSVEFAAALQQGIETAYQAVVKPVEGTILTVAREAAKHAAAHARRLPNIVDLMRETTEKAKEALRKTPDQLPVLKQVGVVDSGGQGLVYIYEGFMHALEGTSPAPAIEPASLPIQPEQPRSLAQAQLSVEDIVYPYDMEFFIRRTEGSAFERFNEMQFRDLLARDGDSILVIEDGDIIKVHVHSRSPGDVLKLALPYGELIQIHILNMREQYLELVSHDEEDLEPTDEEAPLKDGCGVIAVAMGDGIANIFRSVGADLILSGGQTMNPSTEDFVKAIQSVPARQILILPNNSNVVMAAQQAKDLTDKQVAVIPTKTIPQGLSALLAFREEADLAFNEQSMLQASTSVKSGQVTHAVRDTRLGEIEIKEGDFIGILNDKIVYTSDQLADTCRGLLQQMIESGDEVVTLLAGADAEAEQVDELTAWIEAEYPDAELEIHAGGQPLYYYLFSVE